MTIEQFRQMAYNLLFRKRSKKVMFISLSQRKRTKETRPTKPPFEQRSTSFTTRDSQSELCSPLAAPSVLGRLNRSSCRSERQGKLRLSKVWLIFFMGWRGEISEA